MTRRDVRALVELMVSRWPHQQDLDAAATLDTLADELAEIGFEQARAALESWYRDGERFAPNAGQILGRVADLALDIPPWHVVKAALLRTAQTQAVDVPSGCPYGTCEGNGIVLDWETNTGFPCRCRPERQAARRDSRAARHPRIVEFLDLVGLDEIADIAHDRTAAAQVRKKWEAFALDLRRQVSYSGMAAAGLPALERIGSSRMARRALGTDSPRQRDYAALVAGGER